MYLRHDSIRLYAFYYKYKKQSKSNEWVIYSCYSVWNLFHCPSPAFLPKKRQISQTSGLVKVYCVSLYTTYFWLDFELRKLYQRSPVEHSAQI